MKKFFAVLLKCIIFFVCWAISVSMIPVPKTSDSALWRFWAELIPFAAIVIFTLGFWLIEKRKLDLYVIGNISKGAAVGILTGVLWLGVPLGIMTLTGFAKYVGQSDVDRLWLWFVSAFLNTVMQELLVRGYIYQLIKKNYNIPAAAAATTALFVLLHGGAFEAGIVPVLNIAAMSLMVTALMEYTQSLTAPIFAHFIWNSVGCLIFGAVSLADDYPNLMVFDFMGNSVISGGEYKLEGSVFVTAINIILFVIFMILCRVKKGKDNKSVQTV